MLKSLVNKHYPSIRQGTRITGNVSFSPTANFEGTRTERPATYGALLVFLSVVSGTD